MTYEDVKKIRETEDFKDNQLRELQRLITEAVEKQIAKYPDIYGDGCDDKGELIYDMWSCPNCGAEYEIDSDIYDYCPKCGQHINRSNIEY